MDFKDFVSREEAFKTFVTFRKEIFSAADKGNFSDAFVELCTKALSGDCVAQDCVAYFYNKGFENELNPNYEYYLAWQILAGANGNIFALEKLEFFLKPALDEILEDDELLRQAFYYGNITKDNAIAVISNLLCEGIVDELGLNPKDLIHPQKQASLYSPEKVRPFSNALNKALPRVEDFLAS